MKILVTNKSPRVKGVQVTAVRRAASEMTLAVGLPEAELSILLCDDEAIHALNRDYRHKDKPTDVLAFAMREGEGGERAGNVLGDVVISLETAARQANERKVTVIAEVFMLLAHGLLHLLGWDHRTDAEDRRMRKEVARLVAAATTIDGRAKSHARIR